MLSRERFDDAVYITLYCVGIFVETWRPNAFFISEYINHTVVLVEEDFAL